MLPCRSAGAGGDLSLRFFYRLTSFAIRATGEAIESATRRNRDADRDNFSETLASAIRGYDHRYSLLNLCPIRVLGYLSPIFRPCFPRDSTYYPPVLVSEFPPPTAGDTAPAVSRLLSTIVNSDRGFLRNLLFRV